MTTLAARAVPAVVLIILLAAATSPQQGSAQMSHDRTAVSSTPRTHPYVGMWVTDDGRVRHELLTNGRYDEARGERESAYRGRYEVTGSHIEYWDDTGFTADGDFVDANTLHHGGMVLRRRR